MADDIAAIAELATASSDLVSFRAGMLSYIDERIGIDLGSLHNTAVHQYTVFGYDSPLRPADASRFLRELSREEIRGMLCGRTVLESDLFSAQRRGQLTLWRMLNQLNVHSSVTCIWPGRSYLSSFHLARAGVGHSFRWSELEWLDAILPMIRVSEALLTSARLEASRFECWADATGLNEQERRVADLALRGLNEREIAAASGRPHAIVRDQMRGVLRKARVASRSELALAELNADLARLPRNGCDWSMFEQVC